MYYFYYLGYKNALNCIKLNGPTFFAKIIGYINDMVEYETIKCKYYFTIYRMNKYYIFLILTDGFINDMDGTTDEIVRASGLPISIIIVGIGDEDFAPMRVY